MDGNLNLIMRMYRATEHGKVKHDATDPTPFFRIWVSLPSLTLYASLRRRLQFYTNALSIGNHVY